MTAVLARPPLHDLPMSKAQSGARRQSARLHQRDDDYDSQNGTKHSTDKVSQQLTTKAPAPASNAKKRKSTYDEDDDGFKFSRVKKKRPSQVVDEQPEQLAKPLPAVVEEPVKEARHEIPKSRATENGQRKKNQAQPSPPTNKRRRMSFSTPSKQDPPPVRRSKRLSSENQERPGSPVQHPQELKPSKVRKDKPVKLKPPAEPEVEPHPTTNHEAQPTDDDSHSSTKIALPFADTPVISRNKAMREGKSGKGERRSSLSLRGRRASSLIDSGSSNALPHSEVDPKDFYKHIESDLMEPRRMRQLLTWCGTRAMHPKPQGSTFEEASAKSAARVIEEELLKDLANVAELSDWFSREDTAATNTPLPERPNPKNITNTEKISELEAQIKRLREEKASLEALTRSTSIPTLSRHKSTGIEEIKNHHLSEADGKALQTLRINSTLPADLTSRVNKVLADLGPSIDIFADGIHKINQYRKGADEIASQVLSICAEKLVEREKASRKKALGSEEDRSPARDLSGVLRGLSKAER